MALRCRSEQFFWTHAMHAAAYSALEMGEEANASIQRLLAVYPESRGWPEKSSRIG